MKNGMGREAWLRASRRAASPLSSSQDHKPWNTKEIAAACRADQRTVQTWLARREPQEPNAQNLSLLLALFYGGRPTSKQRDAFYTAARNQEEFRRLRATGAIWDLKARGSPYRGIASPLTDQDAAIFFGRDTQIAMLTDKVRAHRCVFVAGASGTGKSSLVWAGLIPNLVNQNAIAGSRTWSWVRITPSAAPTAALAHALATGLCAVPDIERRIHAPGDEVARLVQDLLAKRPRTAELLLFIDQFEELFTLVHDSDRRARFINALSNLLQTRRVRIVATIRAEFIGHCTNSEDFGEQFARWLSDGTFWLTAPGPDSLREMVWGPAQRARLTFDEGLVDQIVADTGAKPGNLPLMAFALERLFDTSDTSRRMTRRAYDAFGGVSGAITKRASEVFQTLVASLPDDAEEALWSVFRDLVEVDEDSGAAVRRRIALPLAPPDGPARHLIDAFVRARLLVRDAESISGRGSARSPTLEVAHEALLRSWPQLAHWIEARRSHFVLRQRLARDSSEWAKRGRAPSHLWSDERALEAAAMVRELGHELASVELEFLGPVEAKEMQRRIEHDPLTHEQRAMIGVRLALLGDPRPGVGLRADGMPDICWLSVRGPMGNVQRSVLDGPWIAKYPITYAQYRAFVDDPEGYANPLWWAELERAYTEPGGQFPAYANHPAINVLWCEAVAFCRWLSARTRTTIRLPTEREWQQAATGGNKWIYPWGNRWRDDAANTETSKLNRLVAVGIYPHGASPIGALDMAGNVWEWCLNEFGNPDNVTLKGRANRATSGGSWNSALQDVSANHAGGYDFAYRNLNGGFRVLREP
jgi:hypothetical protein